MSNLERFGGCAWKLFQLGLVLGLLGLGFLFVLRDDKGGDKKLAEHEKEQVEGKEAVADGGVLSKIKRFFGGGERKEEGDGDKNSSKTADGGSTSMKVAQEKNSDGNIDLAELLKHAEDFNRDTAMLAEGTTQVHQTVIWQIIDGVIYYRIILNPYDRPAHQMMMQPSEALFISFVDGQGRRVAPKTAAMRIEMRKLRVATKKGYAVGWFVDGKIPLEKQEEETEEEVPEKAQVGWIFSGRLHARLKQLQRPERKSVDGVSAPVGVGTKAE